MTSPAPRFGTDGVRGIANVGLTPGFALRLGIAAAHVLGRHTQRRHVIVGRDTRCSGDMLEAALNAGLAATGSRVTNVGIVPTPALSHLVPRMGASAGAIISASHNPYPDNGIKFLGPDGRKLPDAIEEEIAAALRDADGLPLPTGNGIGRIEDDRTSVHGYIAHVAATAGGPLDGFRIVLDCANGSASEYAPALFADLGADVATICAAPDGANINDACGSTSPASLCAEVVRVGADVGLAFDGDADRVMMSDERGSIVDGDRIMAICAIGMQRRGELRNSQVVATVMSNAGLEVALDRYGISLRRTDVGDRYVSEEMLRSEASLGGEQSGHVLFAGLTRTGDGMVTGLQVLKEMRASGAALSELASVMTVCPQTLRNLKVAPKRNWQDHREVVAAIEYARTSVGRPEWVSVRKSGTEPVVRVMVQDLDAARVEELAEMLCATIIKHAGAD